jgi:uncharacterized cupredoxin-like copper-binding protein
MIRLFVLTGALGTVLVALLVVFGVAPEFQMAPHASLLKAFEAEGVVPAPSAIVENEEVEHGIFEVPPEDERQLEKAEAMDGMSMPGMKMDGDQAARTDGDAAMPGMKMDADQAARTDGDAAMPGMKMDADQVARTDGDAAMPSMKMDGDAAMPGMKMDGDQAARTDGDAAMPGMKMDGDAAMPGMKMDGDAAMPGMKMDGDQAARMDGDAAMPGMKMDGDQAARMDGDAAMPGMKMDGDQAARTDGDAAMPGMKMDGDQAARTDGDAAMPGMKMVSEGGLGIAEEGSFDRQIDLTMDEWRFSDMNIAVKRGERIRFNVTNGGKIPHEFMFMTMPAMTAVNYRAQRADWSLLEHEALYEKSLVLPGGSFSFVVEIEKDGAWMFMCMLPYHMQMGMMGQMATPGMAMDMRM